MAAAQNRDALSVYNAAVMSDAACPFCKSSLSAGAEVCAACGERVIGKACGDCLALCPHEAKKCRWCGFEFKRAAANTPASFEPFQIVADPLATLLIRLRLLPESIRFSEEKVIVSTPGFLRLWTNDNEVPWNKVAGFDYRSGIFWDMVVIETRGQKPTLIRCLAKKDGERVRAILRDLEK